MNIEQFKEFLKSIEGLVSDYPSIYEGKILASLSFCFWSWEEILEGLEKRDEWDISSNLIPFYGDWHDLYCLDTDNGKVVSINDEREVQFQWKDTTDFKSNLSSQEVETSVKTGIISGQLDF